MEPFVAVAFLITSVILVVMGKKALDSSHLANEKLMIAQEATMASTAETQKKLDTIHELVNSRLSAALEKIDKLELRIQALTGEEPTGEPAARE